MEVCRDRFGTFSVGVFQVWTCSLCYKYLFPNSSSDSSTSSSPTPPSSSLLSMALVSPTTGEEVFPSPSNATSMQTVCSWLEYTHCTRWFSCCQAAMECCWSQLENMLHNGSQAGRAGSGGEGLLSQLENLLLNGTDDGKQQTSVLLSQLGYGGGGASVGKDAGGGRGRQGRAAGGAGGGIFCPQTWDGFSCVDATPAGTQASIQCPAYIEPTDTSAFGYRMCTANGTWYTDFSTRQEWTDYTACVQLQGFHVLYVAGVVCNAISLLFLIPACGIFLYYRSLRKQHRIRIHLNLFLSFLLTNGSLLLWEILVYRDRLLNAASDTNMHKDSLSCKILYVTTRYAWTAAFFWMFLEGFHLYRLISRAFQAPRTICGYYIVGWGASLVPVSVYTGFRVLYGHEKCWVENAGYLEWVIYGPELMCIITNVFFFAGILRVLTTELQSHPNEPSNYRRALKATFLLVPLFGLQLFLVCYSPLAPQDNLTYELVNKIVSSSQGGAVAIIYCFCNGEVHGHFRSSLSDRCRQYPNADIRSSTFSTHTTAIDSVRGNHSVARGAIRGSNSTFDRLDRTNYIALNAWLQQGRNHKNGHDA